MYIEIFLHSHFDTGEYLGFEQGYGDLFGFSGIMIEEIDNDLNESIAEFIGDDLWPHVKDNAFKIYLERGDGYLRITNISQIVPLEALRFLNKPPTNYLINNDKS